jgi:DNA-binding transcriptional LysR family regulator
MDRLSAMETFVRVIDAGSLSAAARQLKVGQSAVSKTIAQLEDWLGVRLLLRSTRSLKPTEAGHRFYQRAMRTMQEVNEAEAEARGTASGLTGKLRVSASVCFARLHILPALPAFLAAHPKLELEIVLDDRVIDLVKEGVDVALRTAPLGDAMLTARKIAHSRRRVMASAAYFEANGIPMALNDLAKHRVIGRSKDAAVVVFRRGAEETAVTLRSPLRVSSTEGMREAVLAGLGIAIVTEWLFTPELAAGTVQAVLDDWTLPPTELAAVHSSGRRPTAKARAFIAYVEACMKAQAQATQAVPRLSVVRAS